MIDFKKLSFGPKKRFSSANDSRELGHNPERDWKILFFSVVVLSLTLVGLSFYVYREISSGDIFLVDKKEPVSLTTLNTFELQKTVDFFEEKTSRFESLRVKKVPSANPGLLP